MSLGVPELLRVKLSPGMGEVVVGWSTGFAPRLRYELEGRCLSSRIGGPVSSGP